MSRVGGAGPSSGGRAEFPDGLENLPDLPGRPVYSNFYKVGVSTMLAEGAPNPMRHASDSRPPAEVDGDFRGRHSSVPPNRHI